MNVVQLGAGPPVVVIPGIQGRWEWMRPGVDALARQCRVVTFSLADEPTSGGHFDHTAGFDSYVEQVREALDLAGLEQAAICGVSYGGLIASAFAARYPNRVSSLILVSPIPPSWTPNVCIRFYLRAPRLLSPLFLINSLRLYPEIAAAVPGRIAALRAALRHAWNVLTHMHSPSRMARRVHLLDSMSRCAELREMKLPTLIVTGAESLERIVPVRASREYLGMWPHARWETLERTGHLGIITRPVEFAATLVPFIQTTSREPDHRWRVG